MGFLDGFRILDLVDVGIVSILLYAILVWFKQTRAVFVARGIFVLIAVDILATVFGLTMTARIFQAFTAIFLIALVVIFQEELRSFFERVAVWSLERKTRAPLLDPEVDVLVQALGDLAVAKNGALIVLKGNDPLERHLQAGWELGGRLSDPLIKSLFDKHSPGHDGALVVEADRVTLFGCHLPLSKEYQKIQGLGTRHTAALGLAERTDALCLAVSEERGTISVARNGTLKVMQNLDELAAQLTAFRSELAPHDPAAAPASFLRRNMTEKLIAALIALLLWFVFVRPI